MTVTATKIDSSHESGKNFITWEWPASTTIIQNNPVYDNAIIFLHLYFLTYHDISFLKLKES
jgi:hypothetical protein